VDDDAVAYLMLANELLHALNPHVITIAEGAPPLHRAARQR
jgi:hypothetical protein